jgi:hypothetical protein
MKNTLALQTIPTVTVQMAVPQSGMELLPDQQQAYQVEQQARACTRQNNTEQWAAQHHDEHADLDAPMTELHGCKATLGMEWVTTIEFTKARAWAWAIAATINHEATPHPTFAKASQNMAVATTLLDNLPAPCTDGVGKVYRQLKTSSV